MCNPVCNPLRVTQCVTHTKGDALAWPTFASKMIKTLLRQAPPASAPAALAVELVAEPKEAQPLSGQREAKGETPKPEPAASQGELAAVLGEGATGAGATGAEAEGARPIPRSSRRPW